VIEHNVPIKELMRKTTIYEVSSPSTLRGLKPSANIAAAYKWLVKYDKIKRCPRVNIAPNNYRLPIIICRMVNQDRFAFIRSAVTCYKSTSNNELTVLREVHYTRIKKY
jgi:hypothetical protein